MTAKKGDLYDELVGQEVNIEVDEETIKGVLIAIRAVDGVPIVQIQPKDASPKIIPWPKVQMIQPVNGYRYDISKLKPTEDENKEDIDWMT